MLKNFFTLFALTGFLSFMACSSGSSGSGGTDDGGGAGTPVSLAGVNDWTYWINEPDVDVIAASDFDLAVIDYSADGSGDEEFSADAIQALKDSGKVVLAYMSIGEAEDYRFYFDPAWIDGAGELTAEAPAFMAEFNPDFPDNYKVRYWEQEWQDIIFGVTEGEDKSYLDRIIDQGFDGVYLDIIDAYEYFGPGGDGGEDRAGAGADMIDFVIALAEYARDTRGVEGFLIFPQNGAAILDEDGAEEYLETIDGIGAEDTFYFGDEEEDNDLDLDNADEVTAYLDQFAADGKVVLAIDYLTDADKIDDFYDRALALDYIPYASVRVLDQLTINDGHEPD